MPRGSQSRLSAAERAQILEWSRAGIGPREQARRLGRKLTELSHYRRQLRAATLIPVLGPGPGPRWTPREVDRLIDLIDQGYGYAHIARRLKRSELAVTLKAKRLGYQLLSTRAALTASDIARLLSLRCAKVVSIWIRRYGLKARNASRSVRPLWRVQWEKLCAWLEDPAHWMAYDPARCTDPPLREHLLEIRAGQPRWLRLGDVARRYCVSFQAVAQWITRGHLPATRYGNWWIRESDLAGWLPPCERSRTGIPRGVRRLVVGADQLVAQPNGGTQ